jgi:branched-chain amino acid transport system permease protein
MAVQTDIVQPTATATPVARRSLARWWPRLIGWAAVGLLVFYLPAHSDVFAKTASYSAIFAMVGLSMNVLVGYTGQISLGHQAFLGLGALAAANVVNTGSTPADLFTFAIGLVVATACSGTAALLLGAVALRVRGLYLALVTLVFGATFVDAIFTLPSLNGQDAGVSAYRPTPFASEYHYYLFALAMVVICIYVDFWVRRTKVGRGLVAVRDNEMVASAFGVNVLGYKLLGFTVSGAMAGLAGAVFAFWSQEFSDKDFVNPAGFTFAVTFLIMVVVGGLGNRAGVLTASVFFALVSPISPFLQWVATKTGWLGFYGDH